MQQEFEAYVSTLVGGESEAAARTKRQQLKAVEDNKPKQQLQSIQKSETKEVPSEVDTTNYDATEKCLHGLPVQKALANELYKVFVDKFRDEYSAKAAVAGNTLEECFQAAIDATGEQNGDIWINSIYLEMLVSFLIHEGTQDILSKRGVAARTCAAIANFFEQWVAMSLRKVQFGWQWGRIYELYNADEHTLVSYFRNRTNCKCLDDKHKEVKSIKKIGICCNPLCPLPERKLERSATMSCDHCKLVTYCSLTCQKNDWKRHKQPCLDCVAKKGVFNYEQVLYAHSLWVDASAVHLKAQQEHAQVIKIYNRLSQEIQRDLTFVQQHANEEIVKARTDWERRQQVLYTRKQFLGEEKAFVRIVCNDVLNKVKDRLLIQFEDPLTRRCSPKVLKAIFLAKQEGNKERKEVANVLGHIVDCVDRRYSEMLCDYTEAFIPPPVADANTYIIPSETGEIETVAERHERLKATILPRVERVQNTFKASEATRREAGLALIKAKIPRVAHSLQYEKESK